MIKADSNIKRILRLVKKELTKSNVQANENGEIISNKIGLCSIANDLRINKIISWSEEKLITHFIKNYFIKLNQTIYYNHQGDISRESDQFIWKPYYLTPRLKWLNKVIKS